MSVRRSGLLCAAGGLVGGLGAVFTALYPPAVPDTQMSYPYTPTGFVVAEIVWAVCFAAILVGTIGLAVSGATGTSRTGLRVAGIGIAGVTLFDLTFAFLADAPMDDPAGMVMGIGIWLSSVVAGVGYVLAGLAVRRAGLWQGWRAAVPLVCGLYVFLVLLPIPLMGVSIHWPIGGWCLCFAALGVALAQERVPVPAL